ncbi:translocation/assembly module TamB domain-containing protein [Aquirufa sp.]|jgi:hypothetical protein|uniref:translocation/assembly module TamB domain-containing protein n=1 Tax=Aquirufa sp. TaxID=2676249 RepID=UPI0037BF5D20
MVKYLKILAKSVLYGLLGIFLLIFTFILLLRAPSNQMLLANYFKPIIQRELGYPVEIKGIQVKFFDELSVSGLRIHDPWGKEMIYIENLDVNFSISDLFLGGNEPTLDYARLLRPSVHLVLEKKQGQVNLNHFIDRIIAWVYRVSPTPSKASSTFVIREAEVVDGQFLLDDEREPNLGTPTHFDLSHFKISHINSKVKRFYTKGDTIGLQTIGFKALHKDTRLQVKRLNTQFMICDRQMRFDQLDLLVNDSYIADQFLVNYKHVEDMTEWFTKADMRANLVKTRLSSVDVGRFVESMYPYKGVYTLEGKLAGTVKALALKNFQLGFGTKSVLRGDFAFKGLPEIPKTQMDFVMENSLFIPQDLAVFISKPAADKMFILGPVAFSGKFNGTNTVFRTSGKLNTGLGYMEGDVSMRIKDSMSLSSYEGQVALKKFKLGKLLVLEDYLGTIDLAAKIKGNGFSNQSANVDFDGLISEINFNRYAYKRVSLKGNLQKQLFKGTVAVKDSHLLANMSGEINLRQAKPTYQLEGSVDRADMAQLHFSNEPIRLKTNFTIDFALNTWDDLTGRGFFQEVYIQKPQMEDLAMDMVTFNSEVRAESKRHYVLNSPFVSVEINGDFVPSNMQSELVQLWQEYLLYFQKNEQDRKSYYAQKNHATDNKYGAEFTIVCHDAGPLLKRFYPSLGVAKNTVFSGNIAKGRSFQLSLEAYPDTLVMGGYTFYQSVFSFQSSKYLGGPEVSSSLIFQSRKQQLNFLTPTENFKLDALWDQDRINFGLDFKQQGEENMAHLGGLWKFEKDGLSLRFKDSYVRILGQDWSIDPENRVRIQGQDLRAEHVLISNKKQSIALQGNISLDSTETLKLKVNKFQLGTLAPLFATNIQGEMNAEFSLQNWYQNTRLDSWLLLDSLRLDKFYIGDFQGVGTYDAASQFMDLNYHLNRLGESVLSVSGTYKPNEEFDKLNIRAELNKTNLQILEPFAKGIFSNLSGDASGELRIRGQLQEPLFDGKIIVRNGRTTFDYLNTRILFADTVLFKSRQILGQNWLLKDPEGNTARLNARLAFPKGSPFEIDLKADLNHYKLLNTTRTAKSIYYGTGFATGPFALRGTLDQLVISADLKSDRGTRLFIPLDREYEQTEQGDYSFYSHTLAAAAELNQKPLASQLKQDGITMDLNLALTPEAYGEVQFDQKKGDIMRVYGMGNIKMTLDKKGDFKMNGDYAIDQGDYTFTLQNLINKKFAIQRGSKISWKGDPLEANVDIKAVYTQYASLFPILLDTTNKSNMPEFKRRYPVDVTINLQNRLLSPNITFDIGVRDYPKDVHLNGAVTAFANRIKTDEQELTRQVSNVLLFGQLVSPFGGSGIAISNLMGNFTEMLSNQLSNLASKINKDLNVDVFLGGGTLNQDILSNLQLRASYNVNDRLRITRSGGFTDARNQTSPQLLLGDWALEWFVNREGSLRLKTYNRNVQTSLAGSLNSYQINQTVGSSLLFTKSFSKWWWEK